MRATVKSLFFKEMMLLNCKSDEDFDSLWIADLTSPFCMDCPGAFCRGNDAGSEVSVRPLGAKSDYGKDLMFMIKRKKWRQQRMRMA